MKLNLEKLQQDFGYGSIDYDYDSDNSGCQCGDDYCRCSRITNVRIKTIDIPSICDILVPSKSKDMLKYCVDRILVHSFITDSSSWDANIQSGYYGQELNGWSLNSSVASDLTSILEPLQDMTSDKDMLFYALNNEYGFILPALESCSKFEIRSVKKQDVVIGQPDHYSHCRLDKTAMRIYRDLIDKGTEIPMALCIMSQWEYRLMDGYHRMAAINQSSKRQVKIILGVYE